MYVGTSMPFVSRTRATLRSAEFGFFGVWVNTRTQTPRFCGLSCSAGLLVFVITFSRPLRTSWLIVGTVRTPPVTRVETHAKQNSKRRQHALDLPKARNRLVVPGLGSRQGGPVPRTDLPY